jgi:hypothetical protein
MFGTGVEIFWGCFQWQAEVREWCVFDFSATFDLFLLLSAHNRMLLIRLIVLLHMVAVITNN